MSSIDIVGLKPAPEIGFNKETLGSVWGELKDVGKFVIAAKNNYNPNPPSNQTASEPATQPTSGGKTIGDALAPLVSVFAADQAIKRTNENPPYVVFALIGCVLLGTGLFLYRPVRGK